MAQPQPIKPIALFPDAPKNVKFLKEDGTLNDPWQFFFDHLILALQTNLKTEGFVIPPETASNIALLTATASNNNIIYDSTNNEFKGNIAGTWKTFTLT